FVFDKQDMARLDDQRFCLAGGFGGLRGGPHRQADYEARAAPLLALDLDLAAVALNDTQRDSQAQASALLALGGKEPVEDPRPPLRGHAGAGVHHLGHDIALATTP